MSDKREQQKLNLDYHSQVSCAACVMQLIALLLENFSCVSSYAKSSHGF